MSASKNSSVKEKGAPGLNAKMEQALADQKDEFYN